MLVLVAGGTGNLGQKITDSLLARGHRVRVLGRHPIKLAPEQLGKLESFVQSANYYDMPALDRGCAGVDAVICTYFSIPELQLEGNLLLLRAAERAGVKVFVAATWNFDWRNMQPGEHEPYDAFLALRNHVELSSDIKPTYIFTGGLLEVLFSLPGHGYFAPENHGVWDPVAKSLDIWGTGDEPWQWSTERDAAEFTAAIVEREDATQGGFWSVCSGANSLREIAAAYEKVRGRKVEIRYQGTVDQLREVAHTARAQGTRRNFYTYIGYFYQLYIITGRWTLKELDNDKLDVGVTPLEKFLLDNPERQGAMLNSEPGFPVTVGAVSSSRKPRIQNPAGHYTRSTGILGYQCARCCSGDGTSSEAASADSASRGLGRHTDCDSLRGHS